MRTDRANHLFSVFCFLAAILVAPMHSTAGPDRPFGDVRVFADVPSPGHPEGIAVLDGTVYISLPNAALDTAVPSLEPSRILGFDLTSASIVSNAPITGQRLYTHANAVLGMAPGSGKTLYVLAREDVVGAGRRPARVLSLDYSTNEPTQSTHALIPDLRPCLPGTTAGCSATLLDLKPVPNSIVFDLDGSAYITDTAQATIWRVKPGGGTADIWFTDRQLDAIALGPNGAAIDTANRFLYFTTSPSPVEGAVWRLPLAATPAAADLRRFHTFDGVPSVPDGLALGGKASTSRSRASRPL